MTTPEQPYHRADNYGRGADHNGWIDEGDAAFQPLKLWSKDGAGAISLASVATPFQVKDAAQQLQGTVRQTGVYLSEAGGAGTVQQIDLAA